MNVPKWIIDNECEDIVSGFMCKKLPRDDWKCFIRKTVISNQYDFIPKRVRADLRSYAVKEFRQARSRHLFKESSLHEFDDIEDFTPEMDPFRFDSFDEDYAMILQMIDQGYTQPEIAKILGVTDRTIRNRIQKGRKKYKDFKIE